MNKFLIKLVIEHRTSKSGLWDAFVLVVKFIGSKNSLVDPRESNVERTSKVQFPLKIT